jgi:hypothetical protein
MMSLVDIPAALSHDEDAQVLFREARRRRRRRRIAVTLLVAVTGVAGYVTLSGGGAPSTVSRPGRGAGTAPPRQVAIQGTTNCARADLRASAITTGAGAGSAIVRLAFQNIGEARCSVAGVPAMSFAGRAGQPVGYTVAGPILRDLNSVVDPPAPRIVYLAPRQSAAFLFSVPNQAMFTSRQNACRPAWSTLMLIRFRPWSRPMTMSWSGSICTAPGQEVQPLTNLRSIRAAQLNQPSLG